VLGRSSVAVTSLAISGREWPGDERAEDLWASGAPDLADEVTLCRRSGGRIALRFPDPQGRTDAAGRTIPHDFVIMSPTVAAITSVDDGLREVWPVVADVSRTPAGRA
jgi:hypothetical protein